MAQIPGNNISTFPTAFHINRLKEIYEAMTQPVGANYYCREHQSQALDLYCETCRRLVCRDCIITNCQPGGHKHGYISKVTSAHREAVLKYLEPAEQLKTQIARLYERTADVKAQIMKLRAPLAQKINRSFDVLIGILQDQRQTLLQSAKEMVTEKVAAISLQQDQLRAANDELTELVDSTKKAVKKESNEEFLSHKQKIVHKINATTQKWVNMAQRASTEEANIAVMVTEPSKLIALCKSSCMVYCKVVDPTKCTITGKAPYDIGIGKFTVHLVDCGASPLTEKQTVTAELRRLRNGDITPTEVRAEGATDYAVIVKLEERGRHQLSVKVNGTHVCNSPFSVFVRNPRRREPETQLSAVPIPGGMTYNNGKIYVSDRQENAVVILDLSFNRIGSIQGLKIPSEITTDHQANIYVTTFGDHKLHKFTTDGRHVKSVGGKGTTPGMFNFPNGIRTSTDNHIFVCDTGNNRIQVFDTDLHLLKTIKSGFCEPLDLDFDSTGNMYVVNSAENQIQVLSPNGNSLCTIGKNGKNPGELNRPVCIKVTGELLYVTERYNDRVSIFHTSGVLHATFGEGYLQEPEGLTIDEDGFVYVSSPTSCALLAF